MNVVVVTEQLQYDDSIERYRYDARELQGERSPLDSSPTRIGVPYLTLTPFSHNYKKKHVHDPLSTLITDSDFGSTDV